MTEASVRQQLAEEIREHKGAFIALGIVLILLGGVAIFLPFVTTLATELMVGAILLVGGIVQFVHAFRSGDWQGTLMEILVAVLYLVAGGWLLINPFAGIVSLGIVLSVFFIVEGISKMALANRIRPLTNWGWVLFSGIVTLALGGLLLLGLPYTAFWAIGLLVGIDLLFSGFSMLMLTLTAKEIQEGGIDCTLHPELC